MSILEMSVFGGVMILAVVAIRALAINRLPKKTFLALWDITLVRLLVPYSLPSIFSVYSLLSRLVSSAKPEPVGTGVSAVQLTNLPVSGTGAALSDSIVPAGLRMADGFHVADSCIIEPYLLIWLAGILACALFFTAAYVKCCREFRESLPVENSFAQDWLGARPIHRRIRLRQSDRITAPLTYGVFRPVILLPKHTDWSDKNTLAYVLAHEYVHIRRFDAVMKLALTAALCVHWFNPAVWGMYVLANRDMELSCDEAVIRLFGENTKAAYAMALIHMEEARSGLRPLCNNFSKHAIEERITAIMKMKKRTWIAAACAFALVFSVMTVFATSAKAQDDGQNQFDGNLSSQAESVYADSTMMSYTSSKDGRTYYSMDGGATWTPMTEEEWSAVSGWKDVEWWAVEEYAAWLEQEKADLQSIIGEKGWNPTNGWFTWTQEMVDEAIERYEQILKDIQAGQKISKPTADGDTMIQFGYDPDLQIGVTDTTTVLGTAAVMDSIPGDAGTSGNGQILTPELLADYKAYGMTYDEAEGAFYFKGKLVRYFFDGYTLENGVATIYDHVNKDGVVDVHTLRQATQNSDGSMNPGGKLVGIEEYGQEEFDSRFIMTPAMTQETAIAFGFTGSAGGVTFEERFAMYQDFGITYVEADGASGRGNVYLNGQLVSHFADVMPEGSAFSFASAEQGGIDVQTVYDSDGNLTGLKTTAD